jgi:hypothetical protein
MSRQQVKKIATSMPQYQACLDVIEEGLLFGGHAGVLKVRFFYCPTELLVYIRN